MDERAGRVIERIEPLIEPPDPVLVGRQPARFLQGRKNRLATLQKLPALRAWHLPLQGGESCVRDGHIHLPLCVERVPLRQRFSDLQALPVRPQRFDAITLRPLILQEGISAGGMIGLCCSRPFCRHWSGSNAGLGWKAATACLASNRPAFESGSGRLKRFAERF